MTKLKDRVKRTINNVQERLCINLLTQDECNGRLNATSFLKFFRGSALTVPFSLGRSIRGVRFDNPELDPFSYCLAKQDMNKFDENRFAEDFHDIALAESNFLVKDFMKDLSNHDISGFPSWTIAFPWEENGFLDLQTKYPKLLLKNREPYVQSKISKKGIFMSVNESALSHGVQFRDLIAKILVEGFNPKYPRPRVHLLKNQKSWRWVMAGDGNHRAHTMSALNSLVLPVTISKVVDRSKSNKWPNVVNGEYTQIEAEAVFDLVFKGDVRIRGCV